MLVILRENVPNLGRIGEVVKVKDGYARNFLLPRNLVVAADEGNVAVIEHHKKTLEKKRLSQRASAQELANKLNEFSCNIQRKVGEYDKLFGSVTNTDIAEVLNKAGFAVDKRSIVIEKAIKTLGVHPVIVKLETDVSATVKVWVVKE
ncbi:50S ribosomal protein L9 [Bdellovibrionota bacterium FG-2]